MVYGLNFNSTPIPPPIKKRFAERLRLSKCAHMRYVGTRAHDPLHQVCPSCHEPLEKGDWFYLQGVATSPEEREQMLIQANNGHRRLYWEAKATAAAPFYGIYTS